jgi:hypothetical protein
MSGDEEFLTRWSRRKRAAAESAPPAVPATQDNNAPPANAPPAAAADGKSEEKAAAEFDPASLPPIESITALSDISAFLRAGVPEELTRAALRRVWSADPAIRDFIGLSENAWDFTDPTAMYGFGPLQPGDDVGRMVAEIMNRSSRAPEQLASVMPAEKSPLAASDSKAAPPAAGQSDRNHEESWQPDEEEKNLLPGMDRGAPVTAAKVDAAVQKESPEVEDERKLLPRTHGGALPH